MKNLLMPLTIVMWYFITYFALFGVFVSFPLMFDMGWLWLIFLYSILIGLVSMLYSIATGFSIGVLYFYKLNWVAVIIHSIAGLMATISFITFYSQNWAMIVRNGNEAPLLSFMWDDSPIKVILLVPGFISIFVGIIYVMTILPIVTKVQSKNETERINN